jgi:hypothetical protein
MYPIPPLSDLIDEVKETHESIVANLVVATKGPESEQFKDILQNVIARLDANEAESTYYDPSVRCDHRALLKASKTVPNQQGERPKALDAFLEWLKSLFQQAEEAKDTDPDLFKKAFDTMQDIAKGYAVFVVEFGIMEMKRLIAQSIEDPMYSTEWQNSSKDLMKVPANDFDAVKSILKPHGGKIDRSLKLTWKRSIYNGVDRLSVFPHEKKKLGNNEYQTMHHNKTHIALFPERVISAFVRSFMKNMANFERQGLSYYYSDQRVANYENETNELLHTAESLLNNASMWTDFVWPCSDAGCELITVTGKLALTRQCNTSLTSGMRIQDVNNRRVAMQSRIHDKMKESLKGYENSELDPLLSRYEADIEDFESCYLKYDLTDPKQISTLVGRFHTVYIEGFCNLISKVTSFCEDAWKLYREVCDAWDSEVYADRIMLSFAKESKTLGSHQLRMKELLEENPALGHKYVMVQNIPPVTSISENETELRYCAVKNFVMCTGSRNNMSQVSVYAQRVRFSKETPALYQVFSDPHLLEFIWSMVMIYRLPDYANNETLYSPSVQNAWNGKSHNLALTTKQKLPILILEMDYTPSWLTTLCRISPKPQKYAIRQDVTPGENRFCAHCYNSTGTIQGMFLCTMCCSLAALYGLWEKYMKHTDTEFSDIGKEVLGYVASKKTTFYEAVFTFLHENSLNCESELYPLLWEFQTIEPSAKKFQEYMFLVIRLLNQVYNDSNELEKGLQFIKNIAKKVERNSLTYDASVWTYPYDCCYC